MVGAPDQGVRGCLATALYHNEPVSFEITMDRCFWVQNGPISFPVRTHKIGTSTLIPDNHEKF